MAFVTKTSTLPLLPSTLPTVLPDLPAGVQDPAITEWKTLLDAWYANFLLAYNAQQQSILTQIQTANSL